MSALPFIIVGAGGHAKVLADALLTTGATLKGFTDADPSRWPQQLLDLPVLGNDDFLLKTFSPQSVMLVNGIGSVASTRKRREVFDNFKQRGYNFATVQHPHSMVSRHARLGEGVQVLAGAVIQVSSVIGDNCIINSNASVDHDCEIGAHVHIAPGVTLSGGVKIGSGSHIGTGAIVIQGIRIGAACVIGAGAVVTRDVQDGVTAIGIPARDRS